jgi:hypothetical protein
MTDHSIIQEIGISFGAARTLMRRTIVLNSAKETKTL